MNNSKRYNAKIGDLSSDISNLFDGGGNDLIPNITIDNVNTDIGKYIGASIYAKSACKGYQYPDASSQVLYSFNPGDFVGIVYSWNKDKNNNNLWFSFYPTQTDFDNFTNAFYVPQNQSALTSPNSAAIQTAQTQAAQAQAMQTLGTIPYYLNKYLPYIIAIGAAAIIIPSLTKSKTLAV